MTLKSTTTEDLFLCFQISHEPIYYADKMEMQTGFDMVQ